MNNSKRIDFKSKHTQLILLVVLVIFSVYLRLQIPQSLVEGQDDEVYHSFALRMVAGESFPGGYYWPSGMTLFLYGLYSLFGLNIKIMVLRRFLGDNLTRESYCLVILYDSPSLFPYS